MTLAADDIHDETQSPRGREGARKILVIACGALAREVLALRLDHIDVTCLPAQLHNYPQRIPEAMRAKIRANRSSYDEILCLYGIQGGSTNKAFLLDLLTGRNSSAARSK